MSDSDATARPPGGLFDSTRTLLATLVAMVQVRAELFGNELEDELDRIVGLLVSAMIVLALSSLAVLFVAVAIVAAFWDTHRVAAVLSVVAVFVALAVVACVVGRQRARRPARLLSATLGELAKDRHQLDRPPP